MVVVEEEELEKTREAGVEVLSKQQSMVEEAKEGASLKE